ncbi:MAG TPA: AAA family ATPase [Polyangiaceae bacterium]|nr:AAA family ATPase [Polyangiaceae bacterium]
MMRDQRALAPHDVTLHTDPALLPDEPAEVANRFEVLDARARAALALGLGTAEPGVHVYVAAPAELGLDGELVRAIERVAAGLPAPDDLAYVVPPGAARDPAPLALPPGRGRELAHAIEGVFEGLRSKLGGLGHNGTLRERERSLAKDLARRSREAMGALEQRAREAGFGVRPAAGGAVQTFPILHGKPVSPEQFDALDERTRRQLNDAEEELSAAVEATAASLRSLNEEVEAEREKALEGAVEAAVREEVGRAREAFHDLPEVGAYFDALHGELCRHWRGLADDAPPEARERLARLAVNVVVGGREGDEGGAPVVYEPDPTGPRLFGYVERRAQQGALVADVGSLRPGSLLRASGGFLVARARDVIAEGGAWERLKRALRLGEAPFDEGPQGPFTAGLRPLPAPASPRVVLLGPDEYYEALVNDDPDFAALFRVKVEVDPLLPREPPQLAALDGLLAALGRERGWLPFDREARARLLDLAARVAGDRERLSLLLTPHEDAAAFAAEAARAAGRERVGRDDVDAAWRDRYERASSAARHVREQILRGEILLETEGRRVGVVNGLAVVGVGDVSYGQPMRITAVVALGNEGVIDVEREAHLGGSVHTKGVAILRGLLSLLFGQERPLSLRAQITFEQSYGEVDGDSASSSELFAILSALADLGIDQGIAVTGSVNQLGEMQPIGGVCAKIESFYDLCAARGFTGQQGVLLPAANARHLVLRDDVALAVAERRFHLYGVRDVWEGIEILSGLPAGRRDEHGRLPADSVFGRVERRLIELAERLRQAEGGGHDHRHALIDGGDAEPATLHQEAPAYRPLAPRRPAPFALRPAPLGPRPFPLAPRPSPLAPRPAPLAPRPAAFAPRPAVRPVAKPPRSR